MVRLLGVDYVEIPQLLAEAFGNLPVPRTGRPLASTQADAITYITRRITREVDLVSVLPAIVIDVNPQAPIRYQYAGSVLERSLPIGLGIFTPDFSFQDGLDAATVQTYSEAADADIKAIVGDIEAVCNSEVVRRRIGKHLELERATVVYDVQGFTEDTHAHARVAEIWLRVTSMVRS